MSQKNMKKMKSTAPAAERVYLAGVEVWGQQGLWTLHDSLAELGELARSAGAQVVGSLSQRLKKPSQSYLGSGKLDELKGLVAERGIDTVICDDELRPSHIVLPLIER